MTFTRHYEIARPSGLSDGNAPTEPDRVTAVQGIECRGRPVIGFAGWYHLLILAATLGLFPAAFAGQDGAVSSGAERESLSLNGTWRIAFDTENVGKEQRWYEHFPSATTPIRVPSVWNEIQIGRASCRE